LSQAAVQLRRAFRRKEALATLVRASALRELDSLFLTLRISSRSNCAKAPITLHLHPALSEAEDKLSQIVEVSA